MLSGEFPRVRLEFGQRACYPSCRRSETSCPNNHWRPLNTRPVPRVALSARPDLEYDPGAAFPAALRRTGRASCGPVAGSLKHAAIQASHAGQETGHQRRTRPATRNQRRRRCNAGQVAGPAGRWPADARQPPGLGADVSSGCLRPIAAGRRGSGAHPHLPRPQPHRPVQRSAGAARPGRDQPGTDARPESAPGSRAACLDRVRHDGPRTDRDGRSHERG